MKKNVIGSLLLTGIALAKMPAFKQINIEHSQIKDQDGTTYETVIIGNQEWMAENLDYRKDTSTSCSGDLQVNCKEYGRLYVRDTAVNVCATLSKGGGKAWRLPLRADWNFLLESVKSDVHGLKSESFGGTNQYGMGIGPGGSREESGSYSLPSSLAGFWTIDSDSALLSKGENKKAGKKTDTLWCYVRFDPNRDLMQFQNASRQTKFSVRCVRTVGNK